MKEIKVGLIGLGTVGSGAAHLLLEHGDRLERTLGSPIRLVKVADTDWSSDRGLHLPKEMTTESAEEIINDPEIDIVVELIGGLDQAKDYILQSLEAGKQVVTANKALLAHHGNEIFAKADQAKLNVFYEAAVCGGIPIIRSIREGLPANRVQTLYGILNGTCNYILTRMSENDEPYAQALASAQSEGLAEADPTLDVTGMDPAHKLAILISLAFGGRLQFDELSVQGIESIEAADVTYAGEFGYVVKLLAIARRVGDQVDARVHPAMLPKGHMLAAVNGAFNAVHLAADPVGDLMFFGKGAGSKPTSSAVVSDVLDAARNVLNGVGQRVPNLTQPAQLGRSLKLRPLDQIEARYYIRLNVLDKPGVLSRVSGVLADFNISIESVLQKGRGEASVPVIIITHPTKEADIAHALGIIADEDYLARKPVRLRIEGED